MTANQARLDTDSHGVRRDRRYGQTGEMDRQERWTDRRDGQIGEMDRQETAEVLKIRGMRTWAQEHNSDLMSHDNSKHMYTVKCWLYNISVRRAGAGVDGE